MVGRVQAGGARRYYLKDHLGSIRAVLDGSGNAAERRGYYPFGLPMPGRYEKGSPPTQEDYTGHVKDESTGLHYVGARYYSAAFGQWTTTDPLADKNFADSPYAYAVNNPLRYVDSTGRDTTVETESGDEVTIRGEGEGMPSTPEEIVVTAEAPGNSQSSSASGGGASSEERTGFAERAADFGALGWASAFGTFKRLSGTSLFPNRLRPITALNPYRGV
jgi:RHS repeat-associated protein